MKSINKILPVLLAVSLVTTACNTKPDNGRTITSETTTTSSVSDQNKTENKATLFIGDRSIGFKEYPANITGEVTADALIKSISEATGWNLELADSVTSGKGGMTVTFSKECAIITGPPQNQKDEFFAYDHPSLVQMILDSIQETLRQNFVTEQGDRNALDIYFNIEDNPIVIPDMNNFEIPVDKPYDSNTVFGYNADNEENISASFIEDFSDDLSGAIRFTDPELMDDAKVEIVLTTNTPVSSFGICKVGMDNDGAFCIDETYKTYTDFAPGKPIVYTMTFFGEMPSRGFTYTDADNVVHTLTISTSGYDGSIILAEFNQPVNSDSEEITICDISEYKGSLDDAIIINEKNLDESYVTEIVIESTDLMEYVRFFEVGEAENGDPVESTLYEEYLEISGGNPIIYRVNFPGDLSQRGFSYLDSHGANHFVSITLNTNDTSGGILAYNDKIL